MKDLENMGETYLQHGRFAIKTAGQLFVASIALVLHAIYPNILVTYGSDTIRELHLKMEERRNRINHT